MTYIETHTRHRFWQSLLFTVVMMVAATVSSLIWLGWSPHNQAEAVFFHATAYTVSLSLFSIVESYLFYRKLRSLHASFQRNNIPKLYEERNNWLSGYTVAVATTASPSLLVFLFDPDFLFSLNPCFPAMAIAFILNVFISFVVYKNERS